ncbi:MAG: tyrosine-type recombinase/integrase [Pseudomonadota bacterium]
MALLASRGGLAARTTKFTILTAGRSGEIRNPSWDEVDLERAIRIVPAEWTKANREHRVRLSATFFAVLTELPERHGLLFPGAKGRPLSDMTLAAVLKRFRQRAGVSTKAIN